MPVPSHDALFAALSKVIDPEIRKPVTELGMVESVDVDEAGLASVTILLTVSGCPLKETLTRDTTAALLAVEGVTTVNVTLGVMSDEQRSALRDNLRGGNTEREIPFAKAGSLTRVYCVASGKGGVGKSSVTVNLAVAMAQQGLRVGVVDADVYGFSIPRMLGTERRPTQVDDMILPPLAHDVKVISIGMFVPGNQPVVWRGPMLHRALQQFLGDVFWGDLDLLLLDLPPGTGDVAISVAQLIPGAEILVVTTPQQAAAEVAERAGAIALQTRQRLVGVVENMSWLELPDGSRMEVFGAGGGAAVAERLTKAVGADVPLLGQVPLETKVREAGDAGVPIVLSDPESPAAVALSAIADKLSVRARGLAGMSLTINTRSACAPRSEHVTSASKGGASHGARGTCAVLGLRVGLFRFGFVRSAGLPAPPLISSQVLLASAATELGPNKNESSPSRRCLVMAVRGLNPRSCCRSAKGLRSSSNSGPSSFLSCSRAPVAYSRTCFRVWASHAAAEGRRSGPRMNSPATMRMRNSNQPMLPNTAPAYGAAARGAQPALLSPTAA